jgi:regulator of protease activity HflC (stomatin/prohibitin superfamily)
MNETAAVVVALACLALFVRSVRTVPPQHTCVVELLHRYRRTLEPGVHVLIPLLESVRAKLLMGEQSATFGPVAAVTTDDRVACITTVVYHQVVDPVRATYEIYDRPAAVEQATGWALRTLAGTVTFDQVRENPHQVAAQLTELLHEKAAAFGVQINLAEIMAIDEGSRSGCG